ncbi:trypsin-like cysteine/serine peptidase domain-containing protein [Dendryphion nanum]|uniref:Trypsin-like cysteine/serine peptidase domain-containing protein n=1 Tax=Dendryphion nanum TaxID=256645 RepID=A0A9P9DN94_9PLEO|nr:trypsin-like cysteine/serine peptidase domain-containing protein [Dendryphion nanum]
MQTLPLRRSARHQSNYVTVNQTPPHQTQTHKHKANTPQSIQDSTTISVLPQKLPDKLPGLTKRGVQLLRSKQLHLRSPQSQAHNIHDFYGQKSDKSTLLKQAINATLVFAQEEAGTAICISSSGLLLTCSHCVAESADELDTDKIWWLLFASGQALQAKTVKWDPKRDLALLQITATQHNQSVGNILDMDSKTLPSASSFVFPSISHISRIPPPVRTNLICIGHPGSEDLEIGRPGVATGYDVLHISEGKFCGYAKGQDVQDNSEIGALMHDCWTYWGHSGAPLVERKTGALVGLHSSWDEETGMRRGVGWEALGAFMKEWEEEELQL